MWSTDDPHVGDQTLNGLHPIWNSRFKPHVVHIKDVAFLEFTLTEVRERYLYLYCQNPTQHKLNLIQVEVRHNYKT